MTNEEIEMIAAIEKTLIRRKECNDSSLECVILCNGKRISIKNKSVWKSRGYAIAAINNMINYDRSWSYAIRHMSSDTQLKEKVVDNFAASLVVMPLRDYMYVEYMRSNKK